jgi:hypothetical protein
MNKKQIRKLMCIHANTKWENFKAHPDIVEQYLCIILTTAGCSILGTRKERGN